MVTMEKRYELTGMAAMPAGKRGREPSPAAVRLHLRPGGVPWLIGTPEDLRALAADLERAAVWLEGQQALAAGVELTEGVTAG